MSNQTVEIVRWEAEKIKQVVVDKLMANAPDVAHFIEDDARRRLNAIRTPDTPRDKNYRHYLSKWMLKNAVEKQDDGLVIAIGTRIGKKGQRFHGWNIEFGSPGIPAHPFLRPAVLQNKKDIIQLLIG